MRRLPAGQNLPREGHERPTSVVLCRLQNLRHFLEQFNIAGVGKLRAYSIRKAQLSVGQYGD